MPNEDMVHIKHMYSFRPFGDQRRKRMHSDMWKTTFRSTLQDDTVHYRGRMGPFNIKHALVDPSHTFTQPANHKSKRDFDFFDYTRKNKDKSSRNL